MSYATVSDLRDRYTEAELRQLSDQFAQAVDEDRLAVALADAGDEIDGYIASRYQLPLIDQAGAALAAPQVLTRCACTIAMYQLQALRPADDVKDARRRYDDVIALLRRIASGEVALPGAALAFADAVPGDDGAGGGTVMFNTPAVAPFSPFSRSER